MMLAYNIADALNITLHEVEGGKIRGCRSRVLQVGPWAIKTDSVVCTDFISDSEIAALVRFKGDLWAYVTCKANRDMVLYVFSGNPFSLKSKDVAKFGSGKIADTLAKIAPHVVGVFKFDSLMQKWGETNGAGTMEQIQAGKAV